MKKINTRQLYYHVSHRYLTLNNLVIAIAFLIAASWAWGSINVMQRNYLLQQSVARKQQEFQLAQLQAATLEYENAYYQTSEYKELAVRKSLGYGREGEKVIILPPNSEKAIKYDQRTSGSSPRLEASNFEKWVNFLFGGSSRRLQD